MTLCTSLAYIDNDSAVTFYLEAPGEARQTNRIGRTISDPWRNPGASQVTINKKESIEKENTSNIFLNSYNLSNMDSAALMSPNVATSRNCISNRYSRTKL